MELPMFPLGSVLLPGQLLPLHVFEPRYQAMLEHCISSDNEFGVVLIERGHEVGGGDIRANIGTVARILDVTQAAPGHFAVVAAGTRRVRVQRWHPDNPWPAAEVTDLTDRDSDATTPTPELIAGWNAVQAQLTQIGVLAKEMGDDSYSSIPTLSHDPRLASFQLAALAPLGAFDRQKVLETRDLASRLTLLSALLADVTETLEAARSLGDGNPFQL